MEENVLYKLWLNILCQHEPGLINKFINKFGSAEEIFNSDEKYKNANSIKMLEKVERFNK